MGQQCFISHFLTNAEKKSFMMKRTKRLRRLVVGDHGHDDFDDHDDFDACDAVRWRCMKELMREKLTGEVPDKMMDMQRSEPILEAKNKSWSA